MSSYLVIENKLKKYIKINNLESVGLYDVRGVINPYKKNNSSEAEIDVYCSNFFSLSGEYPNLPINQLYGVGIGVDEKYQDNLYFLIKEKPKERVYKGAKRYYGKPNEKEFIYVQQEYYNINYYLKHYEDLNLVHHFKEIIKEYQQNISRYIITKHNSIQELDFLIEKYLQKEKI
jgi:hypothetical protein